MLFVVGLFLALAFGLVLLDIFGPRNPPRLTQYAVVCLIVAVFFLTFWPKIFGP